MSLQRLDPDGVIDFSEWQRIVNILAKLAGVRSAAITRIQLPYIEAFKVSQIEGVPFYEGLTAELKDHYCEEVLQSQDRVLVVDARKDERWMHAPEVDHGLVSYLGYPLLLPNGEVFGTLCLHDDKENEYSQEIDSLMHHFKRVVESHFVLAEQTRRAQESEARYRSLVENAADAIFLLDDKGWIQEVNSEACRRYGYPYGRLLQMHVQDLERQQGALEPGWWIQECLDRGRAFFESSHIAYDGTMFPVEIHARLVPHSAGLTLLAVARDISARKEAERLKKDIDRITRHDLKTPLNGIISMPELLLEEDNLTEGQQEKLQLIRNAGYRMLDLINMSLSLYQMEQGKYQYKPAVIDLLPVVRNVEQDVSQLLVQYKVRLVLRINGNDNLEGASFFVLGEALLCYSMLCNILRNAVEASPPGETVALDLDNEGSSRARISISSNSVIPEKIRNRFGQKYATAEKKHGTGLGVYSAGLIAETMNGELAWTSSKEKGTVVSIFLPQASQE